MSMEYIRKHYDVPAKRGGRVRCENRLGTIVGTRGPYVKIRLDGDKHADCYHPTAEIAYLERLKSGASALRLLI